MDQTGAASGSDAAQAGAMLKQLLAGAQDLYTQGKYAAAVASWRQALAIAEKFGAGDLPDMHQVHSNLGAAKVNMATSSKAFEACSVPWSSWEVSPAMTSAPSPSV